MPSVKSLSAFRDKFLSNFNGPSPFVPQILIGLGSLSFMPAIIATNKNENVENRLNAAARTFTQEGIALPIALGTAAAGGWLGSKLAKNSVNKLPIIGLATTAGFAVANLFIPTLTTKVLHNLPIKEKIKALAIKKGEKKEPAFGQLGNATRLDITSHSPNIITKTVYTAKRENNISKTQINPYNNKTPVTTLTI